MEDTKSLHLRVSVADSELSPGEFQSLFEFAENATRAVIEQEAQAFLQYLGVPAAARLETMRTFQKHGRKVPTPAQVVAVERGSWWIEVVLSSPVLLYVLVNYVHPTVKEAYDQSRLKQMIVEFLRDRVFLGAKRQVEQTAVGKPSHGNLKVTSVDQVRAEPSEPTIEVKMERREIITVSSTDAELIEEFMQRFGSRN